jgi:hypothetical protein
MSGTGPMAGEDLPLATCIGQNLTGRPVTVHAFPFADTPTVFSLMPGELAIVRARIDNGWLQIEYLDVLITSQPLLGYALYAEVLLLPDPENTNACDNLSVLPAAQFALTATATVQSR